MKWVCCVDRCMWQTCTYIWLTQSWQTCTYIWLTQSWQTCAYIWLTQSWQTCTVYIWLTQSWQTCACIHLTNPVLANMCIHPTNPDLANMYNIHLTNPVLVTWLFPISTPLQSPYKSVPIVHAQCTACSTWLASQATCWSLTSVIDSVRCVQRIVTVLYGCGDGCAGQTQTHDRLACPVHPAAKFLRWCTVWHLSCFQFGFRQLSLGSARFLCCVCWLSERGAVSETHYHTKLLCVTVLTHLFFFFLFLVRFQVCMCCWML